MENKPGHGGSEAPENRPKQEILDTENYSGLYGRLLLASHVKPSDIPEIINPLSQLDLESYPTNELSKRSYNRITKRLSRDERDAAWQGVEYSEAYDKWRDNFTSSVKDIQEPERREALRLILPTKDATEFGAEDADKLFKRMCRGKSDTTLFARTVVKNLSTEQGIDPQRLATLSPHLEWLSGHLFGKETATAVIRIIEIEAQAANESQALTSLYSDKNRINTLKDDEHKMLEFLYMGLAKKQEEEKVAEAQAQVQRPSMVREVMPAPFRTKAEEEEDKKKKLAAA